MAQSHTIVIAEDHRILREGLRSLLSSNNKIQIVGEAENGLEAIKCVEKFRPDLILIDLSMPRMDGLNAIGEIKAQFPLTKILVLTVHRTEEYIFEALKAGADGYLLKEATHAELTIAIENVLDGKQYISPGVSDKLVASYLRDKKLIQTGSPWESLTQRERQILKLIAEGSKNKEIGDYLYISVKTVEKHRANLMKKLDLHNVSELTAFAIEKDLIAR